MGSGHSSHCVPQGVYEITAVAGVTEGPGKRTRVLRDLPVGSTVVVVETRVMPEDHRVRGRIEQGGWVSLVNTRNSVSWATCKQVDTRYASADMRRMLVSVPNVPARPHAAAAPESCLALPRVSAHRARDSCR